MSASGAQKTSRRDINYRHFDALAIFGIETLLGVTFTC